MVGDDAVMVFTSPTVVDPASSLPSPPPSEAVASPDKEGKPEAPRGPPKQISDLPDTVLRKVLTYVLVPAKLEYDAVRPFYKKGMLSGYIRTGNNVETNIGYEVTNENIDIAQTMLVCKKFAELGQEVFYGGAWFQFYDPDAFKWWLRQIGTKNLAKVRNLMIAVYPGFTTTHDGRSVFDLSAEEKYLQAFQELRARHKLDYLEVTVVSRDYWGKTINIEYADHEEVSKYRQLLLDELLRYRNIRVAKLRDYTQFWGNRDQFRQYSWLLCQKEEIEKTIVKPPTKRMSLAKVIEEIRLNRELEEMAASRSRYYDDVHPASHGMSWTDANTRPYRVQSRSTNSVNSLFSSGSTGKRTNTYSKKGRRWAPRHDLFG